MSIQWSDVVSLAPALATTPTGIQIFSLAFADNQVDDNAWGDPNVANVARQALAAHVAALAARGAAGQAGPVSAESLGPMSRTYQVPMPGQTSQAMALLATTGYGQIYLQMLALLPTAFVP